MLIMKEKSVEGQYTIPERNLSSPSISSWQYAVRPVASGEKIILFLSIHSETSSRRRATTHPVLGETSEAREVIKTGGRARAAGNSTHLYREAAGRRNEAASRYDNRRRNALNITAAIMRCCRAWRHQKEINIIIHLKGEQCSGACCFLCKPMAAEALFVSIRIEIIRLLWHCCARKVA